MSTENKQKAFKVAVSQGKIDEVKKYLNDETVRVDAKDDRGYTALHEACRTGHRDVAELLLDHGADIHELSYHKYTPLMRASCFSHPRTTKLLLDRGSDVNASYR